MQKKYIDILQVYRGIAALLVVVHHMHQSFSYYHNIDYDFLNFVGSNGNLGVDFFFVLSGFIISFTSYKNSSDNSKAKTYLIRRITRIYVPYLPIGILMYILYIYFPSLSNATRDISVLTSFTLIPDGNPALPVAWTLTFEMLFYTLFLIFFFSKRNWNIFIVVWLFCIVYINYFFKDKYLINDNVYLSLFFSNYNLEFILGYLITFIVHKFTIKKHFIFLVLSIAFFVLFVFYKVYEWSIITFGANLLFAVGCFFLILYSVLNNIQISSKNLLMIVGNATYSIYLVHNPLQALMIRYAPQSLNNFVLFLIEFVAILIICTLLGIIYYSIFEKKLTAKLNSILIKGKK